MLWRALLFARVSCIGRAKTERRLQHWGDVMRLHPIQVKKTACHLIPFSQDYQMSARLWYVSVVASLLYLMFQDGARQCCRARIRLRADQGICALQG
jgi:hypothetical protein